MVKLDHPLSGNELSQFAFNMDKCLNPCILSIMVFARLLLQQGRLQHNPCLGCFTVIGTAGKPHVVKLFPSESCSCPATSQCYHIIAAKLRVGIPVDDQQKKVNLTQLRRNTRPRKEKRSGRKAPRSGTSFAL